MRRKQLGPDIPTVLYVQWVCILYSAVERLILCCLFGCIQIVMNLNDMFYSSFTSKFQVENRDEDKHEASGIV